MKYCYKCTHCKYVDTASPNFHNGLLKGERIALWCNRLHASLHIHTHRPPDCDDSER